MECWLSFFVWMDEGGKGVLVCLESGFWHEVARGPLCFKYFFVVLGPLHLARTSQPGSSGERNLKDSTGVSFIQLLRTTRSCMLLSSIRLYQAFLEAYLAMAKSGNWVGLMSRSS